MAAAVKLSTGHPYPDGIVPAECECATTCAVYWQEAPGFQFGESVRPVRRHRTQNRRSMECRLPGSGLSKDASARCNSREEAVHVCALPQFSTFRVVKVACGNLLQNRISGRFFVASKVDR
jgi:hypothetical protein